MHAGWRDILVFFGSLNTGIYNTLITAHAVVQQDYRCLSR